MADAAETRDERVMFTLKRFQDTLHDIKTPVSGAYHIAQTLGKSKGLSYEERKLAGKMVELCRLITDMLAELREAELLPAEAVRPRLGDYDVVSVVENAALSLVGLANRRLVSLEFDTNEEEMTARVDKLLLERIVINLVSNAVKFTAAGGLVRVRLAAGRGRLTLVVADSGEGFSDEELKDPYRRYQYGKHAINPEGTGIGLSLTREMCAALGGRLEIANAPDGGAVATVTLPIEHEQLTL